MRIPKSLRLMGHKIVVRIVSKRDWEDLADKYEEVLGEDMQDAHGFWVPHDNLIVLRRRQRSFMLHTFFHELMHAVLYYANSALTHDEQFVDSVGGLLAQAISTFNNKKD